MASFKDRNGREWHVELDFPAFGALRRDAGVDLLGRDDNVLSQLEDPIRLVDALYVVCREQAAAEGLDDVAFARCFNGPAVEAATAALIEALADFTRGPRGRVMRMTLERMRARMEKGRATLDEMEQSGQLAAAIDRALDDSSTSTPASAGSTPTASPSGSFG